MTTRTPLVSVVLPTYNRAGCVGDSVRAVLAQTVPDFELIVVDDGSRDDTPARLALFDDPRLRVMTLRKNRGKSVAVNTAARAARGDWLMLVDSDDRCRADRLERQLAVVETATPDNAIDGVCARGAYAGGVDEPPRCFPALARSIAGPVALLSVLDHNMVSGGTLFVRRRAFIDVGGFWPGLRKSEDREFAIRFLQRYRLVGMEDIVIDISHSADGITETPCPDALRDILMRHDTLFRQLPGRRLAPLYREAGEEYLQLGQQREAADMLGESLRLDPTRRHRALYVQARRGTGLPGWWVALYGRLLKLKRRYLGPDRRAQVR